MDLLRRCRSYSILANETGGNAGAMRCLTISSGDDRNLSERLGFENTEDAARADIVIISGSEAERVPFTTYRDRLRPAAERGVLCYCTNPNRHKLVVSGGTAPGAGSIALAYETLGGPVRWFGKPYPAIYRHAQSLVSKITADRIVCIGDSIEHDIAGAAGAGLASCLVRTGILAAISENDLALLCDTHGARPDFLMLGFRA